MRRHGRNGHSKLYQECNQSNRRHSPSRSRSRQSNRSSSRSESEDSEQVTRPRVQRGGESQSPFVLSPSSSFAEPFVEQRTTREYTERGDQKRGTIKTRYSHSLPVISSVERQHYSRFRSDRTQVRIRKGPVRGEHPGGQPPRRRGRLSQQGDVGSESKPVAGKPCPFVSCAPQVLLRESATRRRGDQRAESRRHLLPRPATEDQSG